MATTAYTSSYTGAQIDAAIGAVSGKAEKSEMSVVDGTGTDADKTTITLKSGTSATVLTTHQDISGKADASDVTTLQGYFTNGVANSAATASTASALAASKTLWGQSFDGSANVSGNMTDVGNITTSGHIYLDNNKIIYSKDTNGTNRGLIYFSNNNSVNVGSGTIAASGDTFIYGTNISFRIGGTGSANTALTIDSSKNTNINGNASIAGTLTLGGNPVAVVYSGSSAPSSGTGSDGDIYIQTT